MSQNNAIDARIPPDTEHIDQVMIRFLDGPAKALGNVQGVVGSSVVVLHRSLIGWPPPSTLAVLIEDGNLYVADGTNVTDDKVTAMYRRVRQSQLTDEEMANEKLLIRGAEYEVVE